MNSLPSVGKIGIWTAAFEHQPASKAQEAIAELEELGYGAVWYSESSGREAFTQAGLLLRGDVTNGCRHRNCEYLRARPGSRWLLARRR